MSATALRLGVERHLADTLGLKEIECQLMDDEKPPVGYAGKLFIAIHPGTFKDQSKDHYFDELHSVNITISIRGWAFPGDRWDIQSPSGRNTMTEALDEFVRMLCGKIHRSYPLLTEANSHIRGDRPTFIEPLVLLQAETPKKRMGSWWGSTRDNKQHQGMSQTISFGNARRIQLIQEYN